MAIYSTRTIYRAMPQKHSKVRHFLDTRVSQTNEITSRPRKYFYSYKWTHWVYYISRHSVIRPKHERNSFQQVGHRVHRLPAIKQEKLLLNYVHETIYEIKTIRRPRFLFVESRNTALLIHSALFGEKLPNSRLIGTLIT